MSIPRSIRVVLLLLLHNRMVTALAGTTATVNVTITVTQGVPAPTRTATTFVTVIVTSRPTTTIFLTEAHPLPSATEAISRPSTESAVFSATPTPSATPASSVNVFTTSITSSTTSALPTPSSTPPSMSASFNTPTSSISAPILTPASSFASGSEPFALSPSASSESALLAPATISLTASTPPSVSASSLIFPSTEGTTKPSTLSLATLATTPPTTPTTSTISTHPSQTTATRPLTTAAPSPTDPPRSNDSSFGLSTGQITGIVFGVVGATLLLVFAVILIRRQVQRHGAVTELAAAAGLHAHVTPPGTPPGTPPLLQPPATIYASSGGVLPAMPTSAWSSGSDDESSRQQDTSVVSVSPEIRQQYLWYQRYIDEGNGVNGVESGADEVAAAVARELDLSPQSGLSSRRASQVPSSTALGEWLSGSDAEDGRDIPDDGSEDHMSLRRYHGQAL